MRVGLPELRGRTALERLTSIPLVQLRNTNSAAWINRRSLTDTVRLAWLRGTRATITDIARRIRVCTQARV